MLSELKSPRTNYLSNSFNYAISLLLALIASTVQAVPGEGLVHWSETDKHADITLSADRLGVVVSGSGHKGVRSNHSMGPGDGFYYFEASQIAPSGDYGFGIATASASLDGVGGRDPYSAVITSMGGIMYNGSWIRSVPGSPTVYGIAVDYRGDYPIVHFLASQATGETADYIDSVSLTTVHEPIYFYMYASDAAPGEQQRINLGAQPLAYDPVAGMEKGLYNGGAGLTLGWPLPDSAPVIAIVEGDQTVLTGGSVTATASAADIEDGDISSQIQWFLGDVAVGSGASVTVAPTVGTHQLVATVVDQWQQPVTTSVVVTVIASGSEDTDSDGLSYDQELALGTNPASADSDLDGLTDGDEHTVHSSNALANDTDGDTMPDGYEVAKGFNLLVADGALDADTDSFSNSAEYAAGSDPLSASDYPGRGRVVFNAGDAGASATIDATGLQVGFSATLAGVRSDVAAAPGSGWHYFEGTRLVDTGSIGFGVATATQSLQAAGDVSGQSLVINTQGEVLFAGAVVANLPNPGLVDTYGFAVDYSGGEPVVHILYKERYGGDYQALPAITMTGVNQALYIYAFGDNQGTTYTHSLNAGEDRDHNPFRYAADYVLFEQGFASAEFMATGWGADHAYAGRESMPVQDEVYFVRDEGTNRLLTMSDDKLGVSYGETQKSAIIANQGMIGEFRYWEARRHVEPMDIGSGLISFWAFKNPYCCVNQGLDGAPPSMSLNSLGGVWRNLQHQHGYNNATEHYGYAVDYRGTRPIVYVITIDGLISTLHLDDFITPIYPMLYGSSGPGPRLANSGNFGATPFYFNAKAVLDEAGIDTTEFVQGWGPWGDLRPTSNFGHGVSGAPSLTVTAPATISLPSTATLSALATDSIDGDISASVQWQDSFDGQTWAGASAERSLALGEHIISVSVTDSEGITITKQITVIVEPYVDADNDGDGLLDSQEQSLGTNPNVADTDGDGVNDGDEVNSYGTNPLVADTDGDGMSDGYEVGHGIDATVANADVDSDGDGFTNFEEFQAGTHPNVSADYPGSPTAQLDQSQMVGVGSGGSSWLAGTYTINSNSNGTTGHQYTYTTLPSNGEIIVHVGGFSANAAKYSSAGVMLRAGLNAGDLSAYMALSYGKGTSWTIRDTVDGAAVNQRDYNDWLVGSSTWLRLVRSGNTVTGYFSLDGTDWVESGTATLNLPQQVYIGLAVAGNASGADVSATMSDLNLISLDLAPTVAISGSQNYLLLGSSLALIANAQDAEDGDLSASVVWTNNINSEQVSGASYMFSPATEGIYTVTANVGDSLGQSGSASVTVNVLGDAGSLDEDGDGLSNAQEDSLGTDRLVADTDGDGVTDGDEVNTYSTNPLLTDSDGDSMPDGYEVANNLNGAVADGSADADGDGYSNIDEFLAGTDPNQSLDYPGAPTAQLDQSQMVGIGNGSSSWSLGVYTINSDSNSSSGHQYTYTTLPSDGELIVRVDGFGGAAAKYSSAGIMLRESLSADSVNAYMALTYGKGTAWMSRDTAGGATATSRDYNDWLVGTSTWLRLVRTGNTVTGYFSVDGSDWRQSGTVTLALSQQVYIGLAVAGNATGADVSAVFSDLGLISLDLVPTVTISGAQNTLLLGSSLALAATAQDAEDGDLSASVMWTNNITSEQVGGAGYVFAPATEGVYTVTASVSDSLGQSGSASVTVNVLADAGSLDEDGDGLTNAQEDSYGTDRLVADSDGDSVSDGDEVNTYFTNPLLTDSDGDSMPDGYEAANNLNGAVADGSADADGDGFSNVDEYLAGTDPNQSLDYPGAPTAQLDQSQMVGTGNGSSRWSLGVYTISSDSNSSSGHQYTYTSLLDDGEMIVRVDGFGGAAAKYSSAGIMVRQSLSADSSSAYMALTFGKGTAWIARETSGGATTTSRDYNDWLVGTSTWLRVVKTGGTVTGYFSLDGINWVESGTVELLDLPDPHVYIGLAVAANARGADVSADLSNLSITTP